MMSLKFFLGIMMIPLALQPALAGDREIIPLWPGEVPGEAEAKAPPVVSKKSTETNTRLSRVTDPALVVYEAAPGKHNGAAVIVCPGGGYNILAIDHEGYEIAEWLSGLGYTAFVLQYRIPKKKAGALQDAQRAMRMVRGMKDAGSWILRK
jgi:acetyl esterase/lipase